VHFGPEPGNEHPPSLRRETKAARRSPASGPAVANVGIPEVAENDRPSADIGVVSQIRALRVLPARRVAVG
jgi:hypothetical protein